MLTLTLITQISSEVQTLCLTFSKVIGKFKKMFRLLNSHKSQSHFSIRIKVKMAVPIRMKKLKKAVAIWKILRWSNKRSKVKPKKKKSKWVKTRKPVISLVSLGALSLLLLQAVKTWVENWIRVNMLMTMKMTLLWEERAAMMLKGNYSLEMNLRFYIGSEQSKVITINQTFLPSYCQLFQLRWEQVRVMNARIQEYLWRPLSFRT